MTDTLKGTGVEHFATPLQRSSTIRSPFCYFKTPPEIIQLAVMMYIRFPLSLRNVEDTVKAKFC